MPRLVHVFFAFSELPLSASLMFQAVALKTRVHSSSKQLQKDESRLVLIGTKVFGAGYKVNRAKANAAAMRAKVENHCCNASHNLYQCLIFKEILALGG